MRSTPRVKICGITSVEDALGAARHGADALGLNFYAGSPRCITAPLAQEILHTLPPFVEPVALFVNVPLGEVRDIVADLKVVRTVQWHGDDPEPNPYREFRYIPAFAVAGRDDLTRIDTFLDRCASAGAMPEALLADGRAADAYGGTGKAAPWTLLADYRPRVPLILAGGLTPDNVAEAIRIVRPYGVDVASGVEISPGRKDLDRVRLFIHNVREACRES